MVAGLPVSPGVSTNGRFNFIQVPPDRYELKITLADGQHSTQPVLIRGDTPQELMVVCPAARKKMPVTITLAPLPADLQEHIKHVNYYIDERPLMLNEIEWTLLSPQRQLVSLDTQTGQAALLMPLKSDGLNVTDAQLRMVQFDFRNKPEEERIVFLASGPVGVRYQIQLQNVAGGALQETIPRMGGMGSDGIATLTDPPHGLGEYPPPTHPRTVNPGENRWELELPETLLAAVRQRLADSGTSAAKSELDADRLRESNTVLQPETPPTLIVKLVHQTANGLPVTETIDFIALIAPQQTQYGRPESPPIEESGEPNLAKPLLRFSSPRDTTSATGRFSFHAVVSDRYELQIRLADGQESTQSVLIRDDKPRELTVICPGPRTKLSLAVTAPPLPDDLRYAGWKLGCFLQEADVKLGKQLWRKSVAQHSMTFDAKTGEIAQLSARDREIDLSDAESADRIVFIQSGPVEMQLILYPPPRPENFKDVWPSSVQSQPSLRTLEADNGGWKLELPETLLTKAREQLAKWPNAPVKPAANSPMDDDENGANAKPVGDKCQLVVTLVSETKDGPAPQGMSCSLFEIGVPAEDSSEAQFIGPLRKVRGRMRGEMFIAEPTKPGNYEFTVKFPDGRFLRTQLELVKQGLTTVQIACPPPVKLVSVAINAPVVPDDLYQHRIGMIAGLTSIPTVVDGREWKLRPETTNDLNFDWKSGKLLVISHGIKRPTPLEESEILLPEGTYQLSLLWTTTTVEKTESGETLSRSMLVEWPTPADAKAAQYRVTPDSNAWTIDVADEFWAEARKKLAELEGKPAGDEPVKPMDDDEKGADAKPLGDKCRLIVKLTSETKDGPTPDSATIDLRDDDWKPVAIERPDGTSIQSQTFVPDDAGVCVIGPLAAGQYTFSVRLGNEDQTLPVKLVLKPGEEQIQSVIARPVPRKVSVRIKAPPLPEDLQAAGNLQLMATFEPGGTLYEGRRWKGRSTSIHARFDAKSGEMIQMNAYGKQTDFAGKPDEERLAYSPEGKYVLTYSLARRLNEKDIPFLLVERPLMNRPVTFNGGYDEYHAAEGEVWELRIADDFWEEARKKLAELDEAK